MEFKSFQKIPRVSNNKIIITEKIDGTNALIAINEHGDFFTGSRNRWITPEDDNYGFSRWAHENKEELLNLGPGYHYGEWYGLGIQRGYGLEEKRFMLFNTRRWGKHNPNTPKCCEVATVISGNINEARSYLECNGSLHVKGWSRPEGLVIYQTAIESFIKVIIDK